MKRRKFILNTSMILSATILPFARIFGKEKTTSGIWHELLDYARWCPSPHNVQPWKVEIVSATQANLYYDPARFSSVVDETSAFTTVGMGMFVECLSIAAATRGMTVTEVHDTEEVMHADRDGIQPFAKLYIKPSNKTEELDRNLIKERKTSRIKFDGRLISSNLVDNLKAIAKSYGHKFIYITDPQTIDYTINLDGEAIFLRANDEAVRKEMLEWIRVKDSEAAATKDGLWYKCLGFSGKMLYNFFARPEKTAKRQKMILRMMKNKVKGTANLAWISGKFENKSDWISAGAMLQRMWLEMTRHSVYMSPFGTIVSTPKTLVEFKNQIGFDERDGTLWFLIRLGYGNEPARSFRLDTKDILV